jgi:hypothetical protein
MTFEQEFHIALREFSEKLVDPLWEEPKNSWSLIIEDAIAEFYKKMEKLKNAQRTEVNT